MDSKDVKLIETEQRDASEEHRRGDVRPLVKGKQGSDELPVTKSVSCGDLMYSKVTRV